MKQIRKYELNLQCAPEDLLIQIPHSYNILSVAFQFSMLCIWAEVETYNYEITAEFRVLGTGNEWPERHEYEFISTAFYESAAEVYHVYRKS